MEFNEIELDQRAVVLVKFIEERFVDDFKQGKIYMNTLKYFIDLEKKSKVKGRGDKYEANIVMNDVKTKIYLSGTDILVAEGHASEISFYSNQRVMSPVFCMYAIDQENLKIIYEDDEKFIVKPYINEQYKQELINDFGDNLVFVNPGEFINRIKIACEKEEIYYITGKVSYEDLGFNDYKRMKKYQDIYDPEICFVKNKDFKHQNEFRILLNNVFVDQPFILNIGDISDITHQVKISEFFDGLEITLYKKNIEV